MLVGSAGVIEMDSSAAEVNVAEPVTFPEVAVMVVEPAATAEVTPFDPSKLLTVATPPFDELHTTDAVISWAEPSEKNPDALNCAVVPGAILVLDGVIVMEVRVTGVVFFAPHPAKFRTVIRTTRQLIAIRLKVDNK